MLKSKIKRQMVQRKSRMVVKVVVVVLSLRVVLRVVVVIAILFQMNQTPKTKRRIILMLKVHGTENYLRKIRMVQVTENFQMTRMVNFHHLCLRLMVQNLVRLRLN